MYIKSYNTKTFQFLFQSAVNFEIVFCGNISISDATRVHSILVHVKILYFEKIL